MTEQMVWVVAIIAVVAAGAAGFFIGKRFDSARHRVKELEADLAKRDQEICEYKQEVGKHLEETASLFVSMTGSYKALFTHLSQGYEKLSEGSAQALFKQRVTALLNDESSSASKGAAITAAAAMATAASVAEANSDTAAAQQAAASPSAAPEESHTEAPSPVDTPLSLEPVEASTSAATPAETDPKEVKPSDDEPQSAPQGTDLQDPNPAPDFAAEGKPPATPPSADTKLPDQAAKEGQVQEPETASAEVKRPS